MLVLPCFTDKTGKALSLFPKQSRTLLISPLRSVTRVPVRPGRKTGTRSVVVSDSHFFHFARNFLGRVFIVQRERHSGRLAAYGGHRSADPSRKVCGARKSLLAVPVCGRVAVTRMRGEQALRSFPESPGEEVQALGYV